MNISIEVTDELLKYLDSKVKSGLYKSRSELIRTAVRELMHKDIAEQLRKSGINPRKFQELRADAAAGLIRKKYPQFC